MKPAIFLRIAAVLTFIHAVLHTIGGVFGKVPPGPAAIEGWVSQPQYPSPLKQFSSGNWARWPRRTRRACDRSWLHFWSPTPPSP